MKTFLEKFLLEAKTANRKLVALLIDPDKATNYTNLDGIDLILVGGSFFYDVIYLDELILKLKSKFKIPVIAFPLDQYQFSSNFDGVLLLSLISGRNPEYLISKHVSAFSILHKLRDILLPTGYVLVDGGNVTAVQYITNTLPIPSDKPELVAATASVGEIMGLKSIYLEAGSGALFPINSDVIKNVSSLLNVPLFVGGGIKSIRQMHDAFQAGADVVVIGTIVETNPEFLKEINEYKSLSLLANG